jgi:CubicO group peptidase (beta-lactamase class C family)
MSTTLDAPAVEEIRSAVDGAMDRLHVPGVAVGIQNGDEEILESFGVTSVDNPLPVTADTLFQIGSTTKTVTGLVVMRLVEQGEMALDEPVKSYLTDFVMSDPDVTSGLTMRHLLSHTGGFDGDYFCDFGRGDDALTKAVASLKDLTQVSPLGEVWSYNNAGFYVAGRVIEVVTGKPYESAARELALDPLGLANSFFFPEEAMIHRFATGHNVVEDHVTIAKPWQLPRVANPVGGIASSIRDNLRYARFLMGDGTAEDGTRIVSRETLELMHAPLSAAQLDDMVGLTWFSRNMDGLRVIQHGGGTNGQLSAFMFIPERRFALAVLTNANKGEALTDITKWVLKRCVGVEEPTPEAIAATKAQLAELEGRYESIAGIVEVTQDSDGLKLTVIQKPEALAAVTSEPPPTLPRMRAALSGIDRIIVLDGPFKDGEVEIIRRDGAIRWLRIGRLHARMK